MNPLLRFKLNGFLKNQRYFEPFLLLALTQKGLSFGDVGVLVAAREIGTNLLEVPSGALADLSGKRRCLLLSFGAYAAAYLAFGLSRAFLPLLGAMLLISVGDSFRSGTHKALILRWIENGGSSEEPARIYGLTRSWSKLGSMVSVLLGAALVAAGFDYSLLFFLSAGVTLLSILNLAGYPSDLETSQPKSSAEKRHRVRGAALHTKEAILEVTKRRPLRSLVLQSMGFEGVFAATKDYLQPLIVAAALSSGATFDTARAGRESALLIGAVYALLFLLSSVASRRAHRFAVASGGNEPARRRLWILGAACYATLFAAGLIGVEALAILAFVILQALQNLWRPLLVTRIGELSASTHSATLLSIESQARRSATAVFALVVGFAVDHWLRKAPGSFPVWIVGALGLGLAIPLILRATTTPRGQTPGR